MLPAADDLATADQMWPVIEPILDHALFDGRDYLVEGVNLRLATVAEYIRQSDQAVRACFLGYPNIDIEEKALAVANHTEPPSDWFHRTGVENVRRYLSVSRELSRQLRNDCAVFGIPFVDTGADFHVGLEAAEHVLTRASALGGIFVAATEPDGAAGQRL